jgi:tRNA (mo5U34)-methyltransferase
MTPGVYEPDQMLAQLGLPADLQGLRILEIGPADGYFTKQLAMRGARVTAYDYAAKDFYGFAVMEALHGEAFEFVHGTIYDIGLFSFEPFDLVLCMGVLYHLPDMVRALHLLHTVCRDRLILETVVAVDLGDEPRARYHPAATFNQDYTNFWSPNMACVEAILIDVGFVVESSRLLSSGTLTPNSGRAVFECRRSSSPNATKKIDVAYSQMRS